MSAKTISASKKLASLLTVALASLFIFSLTLRPLAAMAEETAAAVVFSNPAPITINTTPLRPRR